MTGTGTLRIGTRRSRLALWQAEHVKTLVEALPGAPHAELIPITTEGDRVTDVPLHTVPGKAFFTKEIERALEDGGIDIAVHSLKDLATSMPVGLVLAAVLRREDPRDVLVSRDGLTIDSLPVGARVGTSSLRRQAMIARRRPDVALTELRGNVPTRLGKLENGEYEAIVLAAAGLLRLGLGDAITQYLPTADFLPAVSQGAIGIQTRDGDPFTEQWVEQLDHAETRVATTAERALLKELEGGCQVPVGALGSVLDGEVELRASVTAPDGRIAVEGRMRDSEEQAEFVGIRLAGSLLERGAREILEDIRKNI